MTDTSDTQFPVVTEGAIGAAMVQTVHARDLHRFIANRDHFATWMKDRIKQYGFVEGTDFVSFSENSEKGAPRIEFAITLDMAKELAMVERNEQGKRARQYFIECERRAKGGIDPAVVLNDPASMRGLLLNYTEKVIELQGQVEEMRPQVQALDRIAISEGSFCVTDAAKTLQVQPKALFSFLRSHRWIYSRPGTSQEVAYQDKLASGLLEHKTTTVYRSDGSERTVTQVRVTTKGLTRLAREFPSAVAAA
ncbi:conserved hypothetical protein [Hyphomicrobiales bacterium]|nr:conserved hypothetical protein [Hyphomicrobiales bacterium]CAH1664236.1 conserved hypothetical protein [Hyphomicrobiales bacterium]